MPTGRACHKCGARRIDSQLGLEPTPEEYVANLVEVFREVRRVLRADGTVWLNLGDSYSGVKSSSNYNEGFNERWGQGSGQRKQERAAETRIGAVPAGLKPKDLVGIPWRVAFALQADGWYLRSDIIWAKPNPMPESVTDRPTKAHEYVFLLSKSARYFWDADAVREDGAGRLDRGHMTRGHVWLNHGGPWSGDGVDRDEAGHNLRSVWNIATEPFPEAHFATFPKKLVEPCVKAGTRPGDTVLDPFAGSGTVGVVALRLGRDFVGIELNPEYVEMARKRIENDAPLFNIGSEVTA